MSWDCLPMNQLFGLMDSFSIIEASALIAGKAPDDVIPEYDCNGNQISEPYILANATDDQKTVFNMALNGIVSSIESGRLKALIKTTALTQLYKTDIESDWNAKYILSKNETRINREELVRWLDSRNCYPDFFFKNKNKPLYLIQDKNPQYSPKLCAIIYAWEATKEAEQNNHLGGVSVKKFASSWLGKHAPEYGVEGVTNYDDMASIVNWNTKGGRLADKPTPMNTIPRLSMNTEDRGSNHNDENMLMVDSLVIDKCDLKPNHYHINGNSLDDDLPF